jgi:protein-disulfide isomerase
LTNQGLLDAVNAVRERGANEFGVNSTPTFFINGEKHSGALSIDEMGKIIEKTSDPAAGLRAAACTRNLI